MHFICFKQKTAYEMRISDWSSDVCSSDLIRRVIDLGGEPYVQPVMKLNALTKEHWVRHDWTAQKLKQVQRWVNRRVWRKADFAEYNASIKTSRQRDRYDASTGLFV